MMSPTDGIFKFLLIAGITLTVTGVTGVSQHYDDRDVKHFDSKEKVEEQERILGQYTQLSARLNVLVDQALTAQNGAIRGDQASSGEISELLAQMNELAMQIPPLRRRFQEAQIHWLPLVSVAQEDPWFAVAAAFVVIGVVMTVFSLDRLLCSTKSAL